MLSIRQLRDVKGNQIFDILESFTRAELREFAKAHNIERGRNKADTVRNILRNRHKCEKHVTFMIDTEA